MELSCKTMRGECGLIRREYGGDVIRALAIILVIIIHVTEYELLSGGISLDFLSTVFAMCNYTIGRLAVPLFLMLTGYYLLDRQYNSEECRCFIRNRFLHLLMISSIWILFYSIVYNIRTDNGLVDFTCIMKALFQLPSDAPHLWYLGMVLGIYLFLPILANGLCGIDIKTIVAIIIVCVLFFEGGVLHFLLIVVGRCLGETTIDAGVTSQFLSFGSCYCPYVLMGWIAHRMETVGSSALKIKNDVKKLIVIMWLLLVFTWGIQIYIYISGFNVMIWYSFPTLFPESFLVFYFLKNHIYKRTSKLISIVAKYSFAIYIVHYIYIWLIHDFFCVGYPILRTVLISFIVFVVSLFTSIVISRLPRIGKWILYLR